MTGRTDRFGRRVRGGAVLGFLVTLCAIAAAGELLHADGRRQDVEGLRQISGGRWTYEIDGHLAAVRSGDVVVVTADDGTSAEIIPALVDAAPGPEVEALLAQVGDKGFDGWREAGDVLGRTPSRATHDALLDLAGSRDKRLRERAVVLLTMLHTRESVLAAAETVVGEKDRALRRQGASALFSVQEILVRSECGDVLAKGLADKDTQVRVVFALLAAPLANETALAILRDEGVKHTDHHFRESAAVALARAGDATGEATLVAMLRRSRLPGFDGVDNATMTTYLVREQVEICELLGKLGTDAGRDALDAATKSKHAAVREAATAALAGE